MEKCYHRYFVNNGNVLGYDHFDGSFLTSGTSLYEVIRAIEGVPLFWDEHMQRLRNSACLTGSIIPFNPSEIKDSVLKLIKTNEVDTGNIKIVFNYPAKNNTVCNFIVYFIKHSYPSDDDYKNGVDTILFHGERHTPKAKVADVSFLDVVSKEIADHGVYEAILVDGEGNITEGSKSNIFLLQSNSIYTAPGEKVLGGITRHYVMSVCKDNNLEVFEKCINYKDLQQIEALFISGTSPKILPVRRIDNLTFNSANHPIIRKLMQGYNQILSNYVSQAKLIYSSL
ncbi:MAG: aminotransferase class IV [Syntrophomonadaceae bacterium]|nr:aminotransferase class IV [Syntrophomonadaceae bacterium]MDD3888531.1 aminotransferase class IV [Syntrophomonadaceae bacterium]MDD4548626.1 aminotransferase class IV [Syntrophomonadaceae bacterium]